MRLIDADKLCTDLMERWDIADKQKEELVKQVMADIVTPIVVSQPTVEPERKKGKWISKGCGEYRCSSCRNIVDLDEEILMSIKRFYYCPVCGADMK